MDIGFYHPDRGYWQAIDGDAEKLLPTYPAGTVQVPLKPGADYEWQDDAWVYVKPDPAPAPVPASISRRQFYEQLADIGKITQGEAFDATASGTIPPALNTILNGMTDEDAKFRAAMKLVGSQDFNRDDPLVMVFAISQGMSEADVDNFWRAAANL